MPGDEVGCLYYSLRDKSFVAPTIHDGVLAPDIVCHFGKPGGILPQLYDGDRLATQWRAEPAPAS